MPINSRDHNHLETEGRLAYARKGLAVGQPFTKTTEGGKSPDRERSGWHDKAGFCAQVRKILAQVFQDFCSSVVGFLLKCVGFLAQVPRILHFRDSCSC